MSALIAEVPGERTAAPARVLPGPDRDTLRKLYRTMVISRAIDDREIRLKHQNRVFFQLSSAGHEAVTAVAGLLLRPSYDWFYPYYRDRALCLQLGMSPYEQFLNSVGARDDENSGARQMPAHWGSRRLNIVSQSSPTGTQFLQAVGAAEANYRYFATGTHDARLGPYHNDEIVYVSSGEGTTSQGEFWESLNTACNLRLPVLYLIEDNGYAISVPVETQTAGGSISNLAAGCPDLLIERCDGTDVFDSFRALRNAIRHCRTRRGPALVHARVARLYPHSVSDDDRQYRTAEDLASDAARDPLPRLKSVLLERSYATAAGLGNMEREARARVDAEADRALAAPQPGADSWRLHLHSAEADPASTAFDTERTAPVEGTAATMADHLNRCLHEEMARDPRMLVFGEDVADLSREEHLDALQGKGGVFKVTANLQRRFGSARCFNTPLAEANIAGRAIGLATRGWKPVVEIQFLDFLWTAFMQLKNEAPVMRWRSNGAWKCPMVVRASCGGYIKGGAVYHNQSAAGLLSSLPGWRVAMPSTALDAAGLLRTAIRCDDPVLFLEHKHLYRQTYNRAPYAPADFMIPFGKAKIAREGSDATVITYGATVQRSLLAAKQLEQEGRSVEVIDLRTLNPYDWEAVCRSVSKTSRALVVYEDCLSWGYGAEIAARIAGELFDRLDAPVMRVAAKDSYVSYAPAVQDAVLPQAEDVAEGLRRLLRY